MFQNFISSRNCLLETAVTVFEMTAFKKMLHEFQKCKHDWAQISLENVSWLCLSILRKMCCLESVDWGGIIFWPMTFSKFVVMLRFINLNAHATSGVFQVIFYFVFVSNILLFTSKFLSLQTIEGSFISTCLTLKTVCWKLSVS